MRCFVTPGKSLQSLPLELKCTKFDVGWGSAPDLIWGSYSAPPLVELTALPDPRTAFKPFKGPYF